MDKIIKWLAGIKKTLVAVANALVVTASVVEDGNVNGDEWWLLVAAWGTVLGVYQATNLVGSVARKK